MKETKVTFDLNEYQEDSDDDTFDDENEIIESVFRCLGNYKINYITSSTPSDISHDVIIESYRFTTNYEPEGSWEPTGLNYDYEDNLECIDIHDTQTIKSHLRKFIANKQHFGVAIHQTKIVDGECEIIKDFIAYESFNTMPELFY